mgnify:FL=1
MKYKAKFNGDETTMTHAIEAGEVFNDDSGKGVLTFIPFTDTRFFEPIKTRTFQVEVSEEDIHRFEYYNCKESWTVTEITAPTIPYWVIEFKSQDPDCSIESFEGIDPVWIKNNFISRKLEALRWIKTHANCGLLSAKRLTDYIWETF